MAGGEPVGRPLPDIADHVEQAVAVGGKGANWGGSRVAVERQVLMREGSLPGVGHVASIGRQFIAPGKLGAVETAARSIFPFGFRRQRLTRPGGVSLGILI